MAQEAYAVLSEGNTVLTFYYDNNKDSHGRYIIIGDGDVMFSWFEETRDITSVVFDPSFANCTSITSTSGWFAECKQLSSISGIEYLNTSNVTDMSWMFMNCTALSALDLSGFNTFNVANMSNMFGACSSLTTLDLSSFNTSNVTDMSMMFVECIALSTLDLSSFNTSNVTDMSMMFSGCSSLTALDLSGFNTSNVTDMSWMFCGDSVLTILDLKNFVTSNVIKMDCMFSQCSSLTTLDLSSFDTSNATRMDYMFSQCSSLTALDLSNFDTSDVITMSYMFSRCNSLTTLDLGNFDTSNVKYMTRMFEECGNLASIYAGSGWNTSSLTSSQDMFYGCSNLVGGRGTKYDESHIDHNYAHIDGGTANPGYFTGEDAMPSDEFIVFVDSNVEAICVQNWDTNADGKLSYKEAASITSLDGVFQNMGGISSFNELQYFTGLKQIETNSFLGCSSLTSVVIPSNVETINGFAFNGCTALVSIDLANVDSIRLNVFNNCSGLISIKIPKSIVFIDNSAFNGCSGLRLVEFECPKIGSWFDGNNSIEDIVIGNGVVEVGGSAFRYCRGLRSVSMTDDVTAIGSAAFAYCESLSSVEFSNNLTEIPTNVFQGCTSLKTFIIPSKVNIIHSGAFNGCTSLTGVDLANVDSIQLNAFNNCSDLQSIIIPRSMKSIDNSAFNGCNSLKVIEFDCPEIGSWFNGKNSIEEIIVKDGVTEIGASAFSDCQRLKSVSMADNVTTIGTAAFRYCNSLSMVKFSSSLTTIMNYAFSDCTSLDSITIPSTVVSIGSGAFNSESLRIVETEITQPFVIASNVFNDSTYTYGLLYVPQGTKDAYKNTNAWSLFFKVLEEGETPGGETPGGETPGGETPGGETPIGGAEPYAVLSEGNTVLTFFYDGNKDSRGGVDVRPFTNQEPDLYYTEYDGFYTLKWGTDSRNIVRVVFDESFKNCTSITSTAWWFFDCEKLTTIEGLNYLNTANVTTMNSMFRECFLLPNIDLSNFDTSNVTDMYGLFEGCSSMTDIDLRAFVTSKVTDMRGMFGFCSSLTSLDLSHFNTSKVKNIGSMFENCIKLKTIYVGDEWDTSNIISGDSLFYDCRELVGGSGTKYNAEYIDYTYAHVDGGVANPGYLTDIASALTRFDGRTAWVYRNDSLDDAFKEVGGKDIASQTICAIVWEKDSELTAEVIDGITNPNMLIYVKDAEYAPSGFGNVIVNGVAQNITLTDVGLGNGDFYCPITFFAENISYSRTFSQNTKKGESQGWESISMPFTVQTVRHETHGVITPFGSNDNEYPFWLRQMSGGSMTRASSIEANKPYLICMPNSNEYLPEYNQNGRIAFSSSNVMVPVTDPQTASSANGSITLVPNFQRVSQDDNVFALNVGVARGQHPEGSVFEANYRDVKPFEVYTLHSGANTRFITLSILGINDDDTTSVEDFSVTEKEKDGDWHSIDGRKLESKPHTKGVYINNGTKVIIR